MDNVALAILPSFHSVSGGAYLPPDGEYADLSKVGSSHWELEAKYGTTYYLDQSTGRQDSIIDRNGNRTTFAYDGSGRLTSHHRPGGYGDFVVRESRVGVPLLRPARHPLPKLAHHLW